jgi:hypothetical protein
MKKVLAMMTLTLALFAFGCATTGTKGEEPQITKETKIKCPKCGVEFSVGEGLSAMEKTK